MEDMSTSSRASRCQTAGSLIGASCSQASGLMSAVNVLSGRAT